MKQNAYIAGAGMTRFGKHLDRSLKSLTDEAVSMALRDSNLEKKDLQAAWVGNVGAGVISGQVCVPGQVVLREMGIGKIPVVNVENACASSATAFQQACTMVTLGAYDIVLACGMEKLFNEDKQKTFSVYSGGVDIDKTDALLADIEAKLIAHGLKVDTEGAGGSRSLFIDIYVSWALDHMQKYGTTREQLAAVSAKNSVHGSLNPYAQYREVISIEDVLKSREVMWPLTLPMCSPIGDGASAVIIVSEKKARELGMARMVKVEASLLSSGYDYSDDEAAPPQQGANEIYGFAGLGPEDLDCVELHDASAISEIMYYEYLGLCSPGEGGALIESGNTQLGGKIPVNTSGGLMRKGHPVGATGTAQIFELIQQLRGEAGERQVKDARIALAENGGGYIGTDIAALVMTILTKS
jgi:acetyl-CoA acetyltransferase|tara:strand:+ start:1727 stop:2962 length:1236 start_codon:yes stop_codon:yes gene_type:complete